MILPCPSQTCAPFSLFDRKEGSLPPQSTMWRIDADGRITFLGDGVILEIRTDIDG